MDETALTPELEALIVAKIMENKPYLLAIEQIVEKVSLDSHPQGFGAVDIRLEIRGGRVEKVSAYSTSTWMHPKP